MPRRKKATEERAVRPLETIRLVKASEVAARETAPAPQPEGKVVPFQVKPELLRKPRNAAEARGIFENLFKAA